MNARVTGLLSRVVDAAQRTLKSPTGDLRRIEELTKLRDESIEAVGWPTDEPYHHVNLWTVTLTKILCAIETAQPIVRADEFSDRARGLPIARMLLMYVRADLAAALGASHVATTDAG